MKLNILTYSLKTVPFEAFKCALLFRCILGKSISQQSVSQFGLLRFASSFSNQILDFLKHHLRRRKQINFCKENLWVNCSVFCVSVNVSNFKVLKHVQTKTLTKCYLFQFTQDLRYVVQVIHIFRHAILRKSMRKHFWELNSQKAFSALSNKNFSYIQETRLIIQSIKFRCRSISFQLINSDTDSIIRSNWRTARDWNKIR